MSLLEACWHDLDLNIRRWEVLSQRCSSRFSGTLYSSFSSTTFVASWLAKSEPSPTLLNTWASFTKYALNCKTDVLWHSLSLTNALNLNRTSLMCAVGCSYPCSIFTAHSKRICHVLLCSVPATCTVKQPARTKLPKVSRMPTSCWHMVRPCHLKEYVYIYLVYILLLVAYNDFSWPRQCSNQAHISGLSCFSGFSYLQNRLKQAN